MKKSLVILPALFIALSASAVQAKCVTKGAVATAESAKSAKWYALETMVQSVSWGLWPSFLVDGSTPGYRISGERYKCKNDSGGVTCRGRATFCKTG